MSTRTQQAMTYLPRLHPCTLARPFRKLWCQSLRPVRRLPLPEASAKIVEMPLGAWHRSKCLRDTAPVSAFPEKVSNGAEGV